LVQITNSGRHTITEVDLRILAPREGVASVKIEPSREWDLLDLVLVDIKYGAPSRAAATILPGKEAEIDLYFYLDRKGVYDVVFEIGYTMQMQTDERRSVQRRRRIILQ
jgi:hypothetical protein